MLVYVQGNLPVALSEFGRYVSSINGNQLRVIAVTEGQNVLRSISLNDQFSNRIKLLRWSKPPVPPSVTPDTFTPDSQRLLCATGARILVWDVYDEEWSANIEAGDAFNFSHIDFAANHDELIVFSELNVQFSIFCLSSGDQRVIKSPKFSSYHGYGFRPASGHLAVLLNLDASDTMTIHEPGTYEVINNVLLPTTDAQGVKWSPDGAWLAVWDTASMGTKIVIYTADAQYYKTYTEGSDGFNLGIKTIEWSPDSSILALGKHDGTVELLNCTTVRVRSTTSQAIIRQLHLLLIVFFNFEIK